MVNFLETRVVPDTYDKPFMWVSKYKDGTIINESDDGATFTKLDKEQIDTLYLIGNHSLSYVNNNGIFGINDKIKINFVLDDHKLSDIDNEYSDIIHYKGFYTDGIDMGANGSLVAHTCSYHIGWKRKIQIDDLEIFAKIIYSIIINDGCYMEMHLVPNEDKESIITMIIDNDGKIQEQKMKINLEKNKAFKFRIKLTGEK